MLRRILVVLYKMRYQLLKLNLKFDRIKEPYRFFLALAICTPLFFGLASKSVYAMNVSILGFVLIVGIRIYWGSWLKKNLGSKP